LFVSDFQMPIEKHLHFQEAKVLVRPLPIIFLG
jgi:hypothetical protein